MSTHINAPMGAIADAVLLPGDPLRAKFIAENFLEDAKCYNEVRGMYGFTGTYKGKKVSDLRDDELKDYAMDFSELFRELTSRIDEVYEVIGNNLDDFKTYSVDELQKMVDKINEAYDNPEFFDEPPEAGINATDIPY